MMRMELERELLSRPIQALQYMLTRLASEYEFLPVVAQNGLYDEGTLEAVMRFQRHMGLPVTGIVDQKTWQSILNQWEKAEEKMEGPRGVRAFPGNGKQALPGEWKEYMALPQTMFQSLSQYFDGIEPARADGLHGEESARNVRWLQRAAQLEPTGIMDQSAWNALSRLYEVFIIPDDPKGEEDFWEWG